MYEKRAFNRAEQELSRKLRTEMEALEKRICEIGPCRERSLALTKLDEALLWANAAIAAGGIERLMAPVNKDFGQAADAVRYGIEQYAPKREENDLQLKIADAIRKGLDEAQEQFENQCNTMNAKLGLYRAKLAELEPKPERAAMMESVKKQIDDVCDELWKNEFYHCPRGEERRSK